MGAAEDLTFETIAGRRLCLRSDHSLVRELAAAGDSALRTRPGAQVVRDHASTLVLRLPRPDGGPALYWKSFRIAGAARRARLWVERLKDFFRPCPAARAWRGSLRLQEAGIATAPLVACGETGPGNAAHSFLVTEELPDCLSINQWLARFHRDPAGSARQKHRLMREIGRLLSELHRACLYHTDLRPGNIFARPSGAPCAPDSSGEFDLFLIDTDRVMRTRLRGWRESRRNLMQVMFSPSPEMTMTDRMRIAEAYAEARGLTPIRTARRALFLSSCRWLRRRLRALLRAKPHVGQRPRELLKRLERLP